ncbi:hypothetical protein AURDEDRAFT_121153 [Auricularia subglabra TFB-10046 SS5]|nr:hypothetical protein AURDEDRAFT_121153 [Auricularia subglabra TFB-10046 SS5]
MSSTAATTSNAPARPPSKSAALAHIFNSPPVSSILFSYCMGTTSPARLARVHGGARSAFQDYMTRSWHKRLLRYVPDPRAFRSLQARTGFLVSGSQPLQIFMGEDYGVSSDVDIYPWPGTEREIGNWLIEHGYRFVHSGRAESFAAAMDEVERVGWDSVSVDFHSPEHMNQYSGCGSIAGLLVFEKDIPDLTGTRSSDDAVDEPQEPRPAVVQVQLVVSKISPVATILDFHSTPVVNIFTWNCAYSLFPRTNFDERRMCILRNNDALDDDIIGKYEGRGFESSNEFPSDSHPSVVVSDKTSRRMARWIGDKYTWTVAFDTAGIDLPATAEVDLTLNGFTVVLPNEETHEDGHRDRDGSMSSSGSEASDSDSESECPSETEKTVIIVHDVLHRKTGLSAPYTVPQDFVATLRELVETSKTIPPSHRGIFFDESDDVGRDGRLRQWKMAYGRQHSGELRTRLLLYLLEPPRATLEEYIEGYEYYETGR